MKNSAYLKRMLDEAAICFGTSDLITIMLSQKWDKIVAEEQRERYENILGVI